MADGLFLMQRYLGSDDENLDDSIKAYDFSDKVADFSSKSKRKRRKTETDSSQENNDSLSTTGDLKDNSVKEVATSEIDIVEPKHKKLKTATTKPDKCEPINNEVGNIHESSIKTPKLHSLGSTSKKIKKTEKVKASEATNLVESEDLKSQVSEQNFLTIGQVKGINIEKIKPTLPNWLSKPTVIGIDLREQETPISELSFLDDCSRKNLANAKIQFLFPVQIAVIPWLMSSSQQCLSIRPSDLCVSAPTGSGKTLAFVLPIVQALKKRVVCAVRAVVVLPVSELAMQVHKVFEVFVRGTDLQVTLLTGQKSFSAEQSALVKTGIRGAISLVDIVVTTPGRILDHIHRTDGFCLQQLRYLVIDEADRMMDEIQKGWLKQLEDAVYSNCHESSCACFAIGAKRLASVPSTACHFGYVNQPLQKLLYSATLSHDPEKLHTLLLYKPKLFTAQGESQEWIGKCPIPENLEVCSIICQDGTKPLGLCHFIKKRKFKKVLCFTESIVRAQRLHLVLEEMGLFKVREISSNNRPVQRKIILGQFSSGIVDVLVCSDLVARGIDIEDVDCVISYDVPSYVKTYVHRIGRTARAGKNGTAVTLLIKGEIPSFKKMLKSAGMPVPEQTILDVEDLKVYESSFKNALEVADSNLKKMKNAKKYLKKRKRTQFRVQTDIKKNSLPLNSN